MLRLVLCLLLATAHGKPRFSRSLDTPEPGAEVSDPCGSVFDLNEEETPDVEFASVKGTTEACSYHIHAPKDRHIEVLCSTEKGGTVQANGQDATAEFCSEGENVEVVFTPADKDDQMFCIAEIHEDHMEMGDLQGLNGEDTDIKSFENVFHVNFKDDEDEKKHADQLSETEKKIKEINADRSASWSAGLNALSHMSAEEVINTKTGKTEVPDAMTQQLRTIKAEKELMEPLRLERQTLPASVDLTTTGAISPAKNQGNCGSCSVFAAVSTIESCVFKAANYLPTDLSEQHMLDCAYGYGGNGCGGGSANNYHRWMYVKSNGMLSYEAQYPYTQATTGQCRKQAAASVGAVVTSHQESWASSEEDIMRLLAAGRSVTTGMTVVGDFYVYRNGVYDSSKCCDWRKADGSVDRNKCTGQNHDIVIVGYGEENGKKYWKIKNSWGSTWGQNGFGKFKRGTGHCGLGVDFSVPLCTKQGNVVPPPTPAPAPSPSINPGGCGGTLTGTTGTITSPSYPQQYPDSKECTWTVTPAGAAADKVIKFTVEDIEIEHGLACGYDYLQFMNADKKPISLGTTAALSTGKLCGNEKPAPIYTSGPGAVLKFKSDSITAKKGFKINYEVTKKVSCKNQKLTTAIGIQPATFTTLNFPSEYKDNESCDWLITVPDGQKVKLLFDNFETEYGYDLVKIYDGADANGNLLGTYSGNTKPAVISSTGTKMYVTFTSDSMYTKPGFKASASAA